MGGAPPPQQPAPQQPAQQAAPAQGPSKLIVAAAQAVDLVTGAAKSIGRDDLVERLVATKKRLADRSVTVLVVGEYKQGKSSLVNALLGVRVCPVDDDVATSVPTTVRFAKQATAAVIRQGKPGEEPKLEPLPLADLAKVVTEGGNPGNVRGVSSVVVGLPHPLLQRGLVLVDTPGVGGLGSTHTAATIGVLPTAEAVLLVSDASQELTAPEMDFLNTARKICPTIICVLTKTDFYGEWRKILKLDQGHLQDAGIRAPIVPVSSTLREVAVARKDQTLNDESGYPVLLNLLQQQILGGAERLTVRAAASDMFSVLGQLEGTFATEQKALSDPEQAGELMDNLKEAKEKADHLKGQSAKWAQTLGDGFADLGSDIDFDFRSRIRTVTAEGEEAIEASDPAEIWEEFQGWMQRRVTAEVTANFAIFAQRVEEIVQRVAEHFEAAEDELDLGQGTQAPTGLMEEIGTGEAITGVKASVAAKALTAIRGGYSGFSTFGYLGGYLGLAMVNPFTVVIGLLMGRKALKDEKERQLTQRKQQGKMSLRKYLDEVSFQVGKESRDALRLMQRAIRDFFSTRAEELQRSIAESLGAAQEAVKADQGKRQQRLKQLQVILQRIGAMRAKVAPLAPDLAKQATGQPAPG